MGIVLTKLLEYAQTLQEYFGNNNNQFVVVNEVNWAGDEFDNVVKIEWRSGRRVLSVGYEKVEKDPKVKEAPKQGSDEKSDIAKKRKTQVFMDKSPKLNTSSMKLKGTNTREKNEEAPTQGVQKEQTADSEKKDSKPKSWGNIIPGKLSASSSRIPRSLMLEGTAEVMGLKVVSKLGWCELTDEDKELIKKAQVARIEEAEINKKYPGLKLLLQRGDLKDDRKSEDSNKRMLQSYEKEDAKNKENDNELKKDLKKKEKED